MTTLRGIKERVDWLFKNIFFVTKNAYSTCKYLCRIMCFVFQFFAIVLFIKASTINACSHEKNNVMKVKY
jgi:hypothetical protein